jgi:disease resistance protein RPM1
MSIQVKDREIQSSKGMLSQTRSLFLFPADKTSKPLLSTVFHGFKLLRVWDLENLQICKLPNSFNFRYLNLTGNQVEQHPKSIGKLSKLENAGY